MRSWTLLVCLGILSCALGSITNNGNDVPISTLPSTLPQVQCAAAPGPFFANFKAPIPTTTWWVGLGVGTQDSNLAGPYPYTCQGLAQGLMFGLPFTRYFDGTSIHAPFEKDILATFTEMPANLGNNHVLTAFDELSVTVKWFYGVSTLTSYLVQGSPYMTFLYANATVSLVPQSTVISVNNVTIGTNSVVIKAQKFKFTLSNGGVWIVYSPKGSISFTVSQTGLNSTSQFTGVLRVARLNVTAATTESLLDLYSPTYATAAAISYVVQANVGLVTFNWTVSGGNASQLLQLGWAHHRSLMVSPTLVPQVQFLTVKGYQIGILGSSWTMRYPLTNISWFAPRPHDPSCNPYLTLALNYDVRNAQAEIPGDFYIWGKVFQGTARLAVIAEELGRSDLIPGLVNILEKSFAPWPAGTGSDPIAYETLWGGDVSAAGAQDVNVDYGNGFYNDHHFHYGYHLYGAAVIARYNSSWLSSNLRYVNELARDIGNPSSHDPYYPTARMKDWFAGHSWASGVGYGAGERDEESTTEAINGYHGLYMWALASGNAALADFARILLATEIHSVQYYWHLYPDATVETPYPEPALRALTTIGNVQSVQAGAWTWWGGERSEIASIELLPYHPITELIIDVPWAKAMYNWTSVEIPDPTVGQSWKGYIYMAHAVFDPPSGFAQAQTLTAWDTGNTYTNTLWWIATRANTSSAPTCSGSVTPVPYSTVAFQSKLNNLFVVAPSTTVPISASSTSATQYATFNLQWLPGGYNINSSALNQWVTADNGGASPLIANRGAAGGWETFAIEPSTGGYYTILSAANSLYVAVQPNLQLLANVTPTASSPPDSALFKIVAV